jgi:hypothetical protein
MMRSERITASEMDLEIEIDDSNHDKAISRTAVFGLKPS